MVSTSTALGPVAIPCMIEQNTTDYLSGNSEEVGAVLPL
jgi:hypothetical protein